MRERGKVDGINLGSLFLNSCMSSTEYLGVEKAVTFARNGLCICLAVDLYR